MTVTFDQPLTRRELREIERSLESQGLPLTEENIAKARQASATTTNPGTIPISHAESPPATKQAATGASVSSANATQAPAPDTAATLSPGLARPTEVFPNSLTPARFELADNVAAPVAPVSRRDLRERVDLPEALATPTPPESLSPPATTLSPLIPVAPETPTHNINDTGSIPRWTDALALPRNVDPFDPLTQEALDPASPLTLSDTIALASDSSVLIVEEVPDINTPTTPAGESLVTGTIVLPTILSETGAHQTIEPESVDALDDEIDAESLVSTASGMTPVAASSAVSWQAVSPEMVRQPSREKLGIGMIFAIVAGGVAGIALVALAVGALFNLF